MNKRKFPVTNIGSVSLLMIFIVLCMVTLAALSLSTASGSYRSAQTLAGHTTAYYRASNKAEKSLQRQRRSCRHAIIPLPMQTAIINRCVNSLESPAATDL